nr:glutamate carboxypeptidase [Bradyrhizobium diazoefficiens]
MPQQSRTPSRWLTSTRWRRRQQPLLDTLRDLVSIESGSRDVEGLNVIAGRVADQLRQIGGTVEILQPTDIYRLDDTPEKIGPAVHATFKGTGSKKVMLIAHMDTVYLKGMLKDQPFRINGDKAYGLGIADDKQGVALILHTVAMLQKLNFKDYGTLTVLTNGDEEISSPGWRSTITKFASDQDVVFSFEGGGAEGTLRLATSGIGSAYLTVTGKSSHAGARPEGGINALYELSHQVLQMKDLSKPEQGLKLNWTVAKAGTNRNVIPAEATAQADARAQGFGFRRVGEGAAGQDQEPPAARVQGRAEIRSAPPAVSGQRRLAPRRGLRQDHLPRARDAPQGRREGHRRRHRCCLCRPQGQGRRGRRHGPVRVRRAFQRCRIMSRSTASCRGFT